MTPQKSPSVPEAPVAPESATTNDAEEFRFGRPPENLPTLEPAVPTRITNTAGVRIEIIDLANKKDRVRFLDLADTIYEGDPNYIAPLRMHMMKFLDPRQNPAFENLTVRPILAYLGNKVVGRMTAHVDHAYSKYHGTKTGFFGFFECINDRKVAHAMLADAVAWLVEQGCVEVFGPMNFTTNHQAGLLVENFDRPPFVEEGYNLRYYEELLSSFGFGKAKDLLVWWIDLEAGLETKNRKRVARISERIMKREGVTIRHLRMDDLERELERMFELYVEAWQRNWGFVPLTKKEFMWLAADFKSVVIPELLMFVELEGKPVGFCCTLPNINEVLPKNGRLFPFGWWKALTGMKKTKNGRLYTLGMTAPYRKRGLESMMFVETVVRCRKAGIKGGEIGWTLEDNDLINRAIESMDGKVDRRYRLLGMRLGTAEQQPMTGPTVSSGRSVD